jgi:hypothetical protein
MPGDSGVLVVTRVRSTTISAHEAAGALGTRHSPRPLLGRKIFAKLGRIAPRDCEAASSGKDEGCVPRMLRSAPHFAAWCAADPGSIVKNAAPRPGHEAHCLTGSRDDGFAVERAPDAAQRKATKPCLLNRPSCPAARADGRSRAPPNPGRSRRCRGGSRGCG